MDKASVLGDAIKYVKTLQDKLKSLEEQLPRKRMRSHSNTIKPLPVPNPTSSEDEKVAEKASESEVVEDDGTGPEIEARKIDRTVLVRMHCEKRKGLLVESLAELEKLKLVILNANILSFPANIVDLTCSAQVGRRIFFFQDFFPRLFRGLYLEGFKKNK